MKAMPTARLPRPWAPRPRSRRKVQRGRSPRRSRNGDVREPGTRAGDDGSVQRFCVESRMLVSDRRRRRAAGYGLSARSSASRLSGGEFGNPRSQRPLVLRSTRAGSRPRSPAARSPPPPRRTRRGSPGHRLPEVGDGLEVGRSRPVSHITSRFRPAPLQAPARRDAVEVAVNVDLQQRRRVEAGLPVRSGRRLQSRVPPGPAWRRRRRRRGPGSLRTRSRRGTREAASPGGDPRPLRTASSPPPRRRWESRTTRERFHTGPRQIRQPASGSQARNRLATPLRTQSPAELRSDPNARIPTMFSDQTTAQDFGRLLVRGGRGRLAASHTRTKAKGTVARMRGRHGGSCRGAIGEITKFRVSSGPIQPNPRGDPSRATVQQALRCRSWTRCPIWPAPSSSSTSPPPAVGAPHHSGRCARWRSWRSGHEVRKRGDAGELLD